eukprot:Gregarina_sp_Pseudo_9__146@NODE_10_length_6589_cov_58_586107_g8_i0_p2_GENE_NODE_10_length_6589_cov_58_586107_g8_i0NODE_10_length_6589_cov_58_586107_g8_i0_p2_ORF_typecomplete_len664_score122_17Glyco_hydro_77/PF02446_17/2_1e60Glyco_hydro_77/PF02446_17/7_5e14DUF5051/PF16473_5/0_68DUF5051/PF16473_5/2e03_NODE_10_length_6589_cov_58_586107_g8_i026894680
MAAKSEHRLGVLAPAFSLPHFPPSEQSKGPTCGDLGVSARKWIDLLETWNAKDWLLLPTGPGRVDRWFSLARVLSYSKPAADIQDVLTKVLGMPNLWFDKCPYIPTSAFALNTTFVSESDLFTAFPVSSPHTIAAVSPASKLYADIPYSWLRKQSALGQVFQEHVTVLLSDSEFVWSFGEALQGLYVPGRAQENLSGDNVESKAVDGSKSRAPWAPDFLDFVQKQGPAWLTQFCFFESFTDLAAVRELQATDFATSSGFGPDWNQWPVSHRDGTLANLIQIYNNPDECVMSGCIDNVCYEADLIVSVAFHAFSQFVSNQQMSCLRDYASSKQVCLIGDVPIYLPLHSADCWSHPRVFSMDDELKPSFYGGTPPDYWSATGQVWSTPTYDWTSPDTETWWEQRLMWTKGRFHKIRIDHFRAFADAWSIPREWAESKKTGEGGLWVDGPGFDFFAALIEKYPDLMRPSEIIVEDLGEETKALTKMRQVMTFPRMVVFQFDIDDLASHTCLCNRDSRYSNHAPSEPSAEEVSCSPPECITCSSSWIGGEPAFDFVAFTGTHDNPSLAEWWTETASESTRRWLETKVGRVAMRSERMPRFLLQWLFKMLPSSSTLIVPVQDLLCLGKESRVNFPGQVHPTMWSWQLSPAQYQSLSNVSFSNWVKSIH